MISDRDLVLAAAATYGSSSTPTFVGLNGCARVFRSLVGDVAVYAIEGTHDALGWALDAAALPLPSQLVSTNANHVIRAINFMAGADGAHASVEVPDVGFVHGGIFAALLSVWPQMWSAMQGDDDVALTGHSLGAGCAILATAIMVSLGRIPVRAAYFAPPRVGFKKMHDLVDAASTAAYRNGNDPVTDVPFRSPPFWLYEQRPLRRGGAVCRPPWEAHHVDRYVELEALLSAAAGQDGLRNGDG